jgi:hypothetical protein
VPLVGDKAARHSWQPVELGRLKDFAPPAPTLSGISYPGTLTIVYAEPESLKSWLEIIVGLETIRAGRSVVWIDFETDARSTLARLRALGTTDSELERFLYVQPSDPLTDAATRGDVEGLVAEHRPALVVVDAMAGCLALHGLNQNDADDVERLYSVILRPLRSGDACLAIVDHVTKDRETRGRWPTGSQRKLGAADVGLSLELVRAFSRGGSGAARVRVTKDRLGGLPRPYCAQLELASDAITGAVTWTLAEAVDHEDGESHWRPTIYMERVSTFLEHQAEPVSRNEIEQSVTGKARYLRQAIDALIADGFVEYLVPLSGRGLPGGGSSRLLRLVKPFRPFVPGSSHLVPDGASSQFVPSSPTLKGGTWDEDEVVR